MGWSRVAAIQWESFTVFSTLDSQWDQGDGKRTPTGTAPIG